MKQYSIIFRAGECEIYAGRIIGDDYEVICEDINPVLNIKRKNEIVYKCMCDDIEIIKTTEGGIRIYIYTTAFNY